ncbi:MAG: hypothetical protein LBM99_06440, partial [Bacillales bacterium]|nr:hypothetical protein [Bacillales bacterium]
LLKNSFLLLIRTAPTNLLALIINLLPYLSLFFLKDTIYFIVLIVLFFLIMPIQLLFYSDFILAILDKYINLKHYPEIYKKGLFNARN